MLRVSDFTDVATWSGFVYIAFVEGILAGEGHSTESAANVTQALAPTADGPNLPISI